MTTNTIDKPKAAKRPALKNMSEILETLPKFTQSALWQQMANTLGWKMLSSALRMAENEAREQRRTAEEALESKDEAVPTVNDPSPDEVGPNAEARARILDAQYNTSPYRADDQLSPADWLTELQHARGACVEEALLSYAKAKVSFTDLIQRAATIKPVGKEEDYKPGSMEYELINDEDMPEGMALEMLEKYNAQQAERYQRHLDSLYDTLSVYDVISDADLDDVVDEMEPEAASFVFEKFGDVLERRYNLLDLHNPNPFEWVQKMNPMARLMEIKLLKGAMADAKALRKAHSRKLRAPMPAPRAAAKSAQPITCPPGMSDAEFAAGKEALHALAKKFNTK